MRNLIARALGRVLIPVLLPLLMLTLPATGRHRETPSRQTRPAPRPRPLRVPARRRSPYAREQATFLDGARSPLVRPYLADHSCAAAQRRRRRALWLATVGVDIDHRDIHAVGAAR
ncbi:hypothetical protein ACIQ7Q_02755 [Streptomyces sp. NPDC096176]|uniref:hypothetical protein n=1 Tax=Streptomyces sp. NPDC096176 TaxID=3366079 RepID=UPI00381A3018